MLIANKSLAIAENDDVEDDDDDDDDYDCLVLQEQVCAFFPPLTWLLR